MHLIRKDGFSADVRLSLRVNGDILAVAQTDPSSLTLRGEHKSYEPCQAELTITISDFSERQQIFLPEGIAAAASRVAYSRVSA